MLASSRLSAAVQESVHEQHLHHLRNATGVMKVGRHVAARGLQITQYWHSLSYHLEVIKVEGNAS